MGKSLYLFLCIGGGTGWLSAQPIAVSPPAVSRVMRQATEYPYFNTAFPRKQTVSVTSTGDPVHWTASVSGQLASACYGGPCFTLTQEFSQAGKTSGTTPDTFALDWNGSMGPLDPGIYTATVSVKPDLGPGLEIQVRLEVVPRATVREASTTALSAGDPQTCVDSNRAAWTFAATCPIPDERPAGNFAPPAPGGSYTDPVFGGVVKRITGPGCSPQYGSNTAFSAKGTYLWVSCDGNLIYRISDDALIRKGPGHPDYTFMSGVDDQAYYYFLGSTIHKYNFVAGTDTTLGDFSAYGLTTLYAGGTAGASDDDWISFYDYGADGSALKGMLCAANLQQLAADGAPNANNTYCINYAQAVSSPLTLLDWTGVFQVDLPTGKRFILLSSNPFSVIFSVGANGALGLEYEMPEWPGRPQNNGDERYQPGEFHFSAATNTHLGLFRDARGAATILNQFEEIWGNQVYITTHRVNSGPDFYRPEEEGGGMNLHYIDNYDKQPGCSDQISACVLAGFDACCVAAYRIASAQASNPTVITTDSPHGFTGDTEIRIENAAGGGFDTCLNGLFSATVLNDTQLSLRTDCSSAGAYTAESGILGAATPVPPTANRGQIQVLRPGQELRRIAMHRDTGWKDVPGAGISYYGTTTKSSLSRDGSMVAFSSNFGYLSPNGNSTYIAYTGLSPDKLIHIQVTPQTTGATVSYQVPSGDACAVIVSDSPAFDTVVETFTDTATPPDMPRTAQLGATAALLSNRSYYLRLLCGAYAQTSEFRLRPASRGR